jgi:drug/metabolite transporter (DMT)-like permease
LVDVWSLPLDKKLFFVTPKLDNPFWQHPGQGIRDATKVDILNLQLSILAETLEEDYSLESIEHRFDQISDAFQAALLGMLVLRESVPLRTWFAILVAAGGLIWMSLEGLSSDGLHGMLIALAVPMAGAVNIVVLKRTGARVNLVPAVMLGAVISMAVTLPLAWPLTASAHDIAILSALGVFQLGLPCMLMVRAANHLPPYEVALLGLLEVVLGPIWAWLWAGEQPGVATLQGGALVLSALLVNELLALRDKR